MRDKEPTLTERDRHWQKHIRACEAAGRRMSDYAAEHGLEVRALYDGKRTLVKKGVLPRTHQNHFQRARMVDPAVGGEWCTHLPNGVSVTFRGAVEAESLAPILKAADLPPSRFPRAWPPRDCWPMWPSRSTRMPCRCNRQEGIL